MLILLTTSNFPNIMLEAYYKNPLQCIYFIIYLFIGLFFFMNLLLAIVYQGYVDRITRQNTKKESQRISLILKFFQEFDSGTKNYLTIDESKKFFAFVFDLDYSK